MRVDIVTPERELLSTDAARVVLPATDGEMTVMANHAATVTTLRPGIVTIDDGQQFVTTGGFAEITPDSCAILAERAVPRDEATRDYLQSALDEVETDAEGATDEDRTIARQRANDIGQLIKHAP